jgi:hypothetical protein
LKKCETQRYKVKRENCKGEGIRGNVFGDKLKDEKGI